MRQNFALQTAKDFKCKRAVFGSLLVLSLFSLRPACAEPKAKEMHGVVNSIFDKRLGKDRVFRAEWKRLFTDIQRTQRREWWSYRRHGRRYDLYAGPYVGHARLFVGPRVRGVIVNVENHRGHPYYQGTTPYYLRYSLIGLKDALFYEELRTNKKGNLKIMVSGRLDARGFRSVARMVRSVIRRSLR